MHTPRNSFRSSGCIARARYSNLVATYAVTNQQAQGERIGKAHLQVVFGLLELELDVQAVFYAHLHFDAVVYLRAINEVANLCATPSLVQFPIKNRMREPGKSKVITTLTAASTSNQVSFFACWILVSWNCGSPN